MVIYEMNVKGGPHMVISENGIFYLWVFLGFMGKMVFIFMVLVLFLMVDVFGVQMCKIRM
jgi:hypothetical protein